MIDFHGYLREGPKHCLDEFYGYRIELSKLIESIIGRRSITAVLGPRRIGKTSITLTAFTALATQGPLSMGRAILIHADFRGVSGRGAALHTLLNGFSRFRELVRGDEDLSRNLSDAIDGFANALLNKLTWSEERVTRKVSGGIVFLRGGISKTVVRRLMRNGVLEGFRDVLEIINEACGEEGLKCVVFLDELHDIMGRLKGVKSEIPQALAYTYDYLGNIKVVISGSRIRLTDDIVRHEELVQRVEHIVMKPLTREESWELLERSFNDHGVGYTEKVIEEGYRVSMGIAGWLTEYGRNYVLTYRVIREPLKALERSFKRTIESMKLSCAEELAALNRRLKGGETYMAAYKILSYIAEGINRYSDLERLTGLSTGTLNHILKILMKYDIIEKIIEGRAVRYVISDPAIKAYFLSNSLK